MTDNKRRVWIDVFKGILIICVVLGHEVEATRFVYWFHMPLFFVISGYLLKKSDSIIKWFKGKALRILVPYFSFYVFISIMCLNDRLSIKQFMKLLYGGRMNTGVVGVWWYPTCFLLTLLISQLLIKYFNRQKQLFVLIVMYAVGIAEWYFFLPRTVDEYSMIQKFPWNVDVCLMTVVFMFIGYHGKNVIDAIIQKKYIEKIRIALITLFTITLVVCGLNINTDNFNVDMKYSQYGNQILFLIMPVLFGILLLVISDIFSNIKWVGLIISNIGYHSMSVMYLHVPILYLLRNLMVGDDVALQVSRAIFALMISWGISVILNQFKVTRAFFISGDIRSLKKHS